MLYGILEISIDLFGCQCAGGDERTRTADPLLAKQVLSQLSYIPVHGLQAMLQRATAALPSPSARDTETVHSSNRGRLLQTLNGLKSGKDKALVAWVSDSEMHSMSLVRRDTI